MRPRAREASLVREWVADGATLAASSAAWAEFLCGPERPGAVQAVRRVVPIIVPFDEAEARVAARLFNAAGRRRGSMVDCMIAATAIRADATLATSDRRGFGPLAKHGLQLI
jgi:predicted nucleic acid-binding protein